MRNMAAIAAVWSDGHKEARVCGRQVCIGAQFEKEKMKLKVFLDQARVD